MSDAPSEKPSRKRRSGIPTGNAGEYFVMGELLRRGWDAQLADRNTAGYDILLGQPQSEVMHKVQVKTVRSAPWYVKLADFEGAALERITIYVLLGDERALKSVRYFMASNATLLPWLVKQAGWGNNGFMPLKAVVDHENWNALDPLKVPATD